MPLPLEAQEYREPAPKARSGRQRPLHDRATRRCRIACSVSLAKHPAGDLGRGFVRRMHEREGPVARIVIARPERLNALRMTITDRELLSASPCWLLPA